MPSISRSFSCSSIYDLYDEPTKDSNKNYSIKATYFEQGAVLPQDVQACKQKNGAFWDCIGRKISKFGGYLYLFKAKKEFNNFELNKYFFPKHVGKISDTLNELFPFAELSARKVVKRKNIYNNLKFFGYKVQVIANDVFIQLPDSKTISQALIAYENKHLKGRKKTFKVFSINKSISDLFFIHASMDGVILSENRDFLHDHFFHVLPKLQSLNRGFKYFEDIKFKIYRIIVRFYCITRCAVDENSKLKPFRHLIDFIMAAITDEITTIEPHSLDKIKLNENTKQVNSPQNAQQEDKAQKIADAEMARVNKLKIDLVFKQVVISVLNADPWLKFARSRFDDIIFTPDTLPLLWGATHRAGSSYLKKLKLNKLSLDQIQSNATISPLPPK